MFSIKQMSFKRAKIQIISHVAIATAWYSASNADLEIVDYVLDFQETSD